MKNAHPNYSARRPHLHRCGHRDHAGSSRTWKCWKETCTVPRAPETVACSTCEYRGVRFELTPRGNLARFIDPHGTTVAEADDPSGLPF